MSGRPDELKGRPLEAESGSAGREQRSWAVPKRMGKGQSLIAVERVLESWCDRDWFPRTYVQKFFLFCLSED